MFFLINHVKKTKEFRVLKLHTRTYHPVCTSTNAMRGNHLILNLTKGEIFWNSKSNILFLSILLFSSKWRPTFETVIPKGTRTGVLKNVIVLEWESLNLILVYFVIYVQGGERFGFFFLRFLSLHFSSHYSWLVCFGLVSEAKEPPIIYRFLFFFLSFL